jgi:hypothetical protein
LTVNLFSTQLIYQCLSLCSLCSLWLQKAPFLGLRAALGLGAFGGQRRLASLAKGGQGGQRRLVLG